MNKSTLHSITLLAGFAAGGLSLLSAQNSAGNQPQWHQRGWAKAQDKLGLTADQVAKIQSELRPEKETLRTLALKLHDNRIALRRVIKQSTASEADVRAAAAKVSAVESDLAVLQARLHARIAPLLTRDQLDKIAAGEQKRDEFVDTMIVGYIERLVD